MMSTPRFDQPGKHRSAQVNANAFFCATLIHMTMTIRLQGAIPRESIDHARKILSRDAAVNISSGHALQMRSFLSAKELLDIGSVLADVVGIVSAAVAIGTPLLRQRKWSRAQLDDLIAEETTRRGWVDTTVEAIENFDALLGEVQGTPCRIVVSHVKDARRMTILVFYDGETLVFEAD